VAGAPRNSCLPDSRRSLSLVQEANSGVPGIWRAFEKGTVVPPKPLGATGPGNETTMPHAIIRAKNGRRHEVNFGDEAARVAIHASEETVEIFIEADFETLPEQRRRFALLDIPRHLF
jgi:hypothetical protein